MPPLLTTALLRDGGQGGDGNPAKEEAGSSEEEALMGGTLALAGAGFKMANKRASARAKNSATDVCAPI